MRSGEALDVEGLQALVLAQPALNLPAGDSSWPTYAAWRRTAVAARADSQRWASSAAVQPDAAAVTA